MCRTVGVELLCNVCCRTMDSSGEFYHEFILKEMLR